MGKALDVLISLDDRHVINLIDGSKKIELRRRKINLPTNSRVWIYSKIPKGKVCAYGIVDYIFCGHPNEIWKKFSDISGITGGEFEEYFEGRKKGYAVVFKRVEKIIEPLSLNEIRDQLDAFHPPQFFKYLYSGSPELKLFKGTV